MNNHPPAEHKARSVCLQRDRAVPQQEKLCSEQSAQVPAATIYHDAQSATNKSLEHVCLSHSRMRSNLSKDAYLRHIGPTNKSLEHVCLPHRRMRSNLSKDA
jgi:hypothetical protein